MAESEKGFTVTADHAWQVGRLISWMRRRARLTQADLAAALNSTQSRMSFIEGGGSATNGVTIGVLREVAEACGFRLQISVTRP